MILVLVGLHFMMSWTKITFAKDKMQVEVRMSVVQWLVLFAFCFHLSKYVNDSSQLSIEQNVFRDVTIVYYFQLEAIYSELLQIPV